MPQAAGKKGARLVWQPLKILEHFKIRSPTVASIQGIAGKGRSREEYHICFLSWRNLALCYKKSFLLTGLSHRGWKEHGPERDTISKGISRNLSKEGAWPDARRGHCRVWEVPKLGWNRQLRLDLGLEGHMQRDLQIWSSRWWALRILQVGLNLILMSDKNSKLFRTSLFEWHHAVSFFRNI